MSEKLRFIEFSTNHFAIIYMLTLIKLKFVKVKNSFSNHVSPVLFFHLQLIFSPFAKKIF